MLAAPLAIADMLTGLLQATPRPLSLMESE